MFDKATKIIYVFLALIALLSTILVILAPTLPHEITSDANDESSGYTATQMHPTVNKQAKNEAKIPNINEIKIEQEQIRIIN
ncbi:hypothetical protein M0813_22586 [Anaeramoeba flamelloides]|uniref:Uncharacterized protein n=1 Tax=Anaeramoeba flamelloides TaxID=1746091 RepID=A0ABQ8YCX3_9EUKA|nr:hypothetical protein M0813_22586 [Anaeramoeba flamelloides]